MSSTNTAAPFLTLQSFLEYRMGADNFRTSRPGEHELRSDVKSILVSQQSLELAPSDEANFSREDLLLVLQEFYGPFGCKILETDPMLDTSGNGIQIDHQGTTIAVGTLTHDLSGVFWLTVTCIRRNDSSILNR